LRNLRQNAECSQKNSQIRLRARDMGAGAALREKC